MLPPEIRYVVGIDVAKSAHVVCALEAPSGIVRLKSTPIPATADGYGQLINWLQEWTAGADHPTALWIGLESTGSLWEPLYDALRHAGYVAVLLNPHQTASWAASLGLRAKTDGIDAHTLARGLLAGWARASSVPDETVQALRTLTRTRRDLIASQSAARQRLHDELVPVFPELVGHLPAHADLGAAAVLRLLSTYSSAQAFAQAPLDALSRVLDEVSGCRWTCAHAQALQDLARHSAASQRAVPARSVVVRTLALHLLDLHARVAELDAALAELLRHDPPSQQVQAEVPGLGHASGAAATLSPDTQPAGSPVVAAPVRRHPAGAQRRRSSPSVRPACDSPQGSLLHRLPIRRYDATLHVACCPTRCRIRDTLPNGTVEICVAAPQTVRRAVAGTAHTGEWPRRIGRSSRTGASTHDELVHDRFTNNLPRQPDLACSCS